MAGRVKKLSLKVKPDDILVASLVLTTAMACAYGYVARGVVVHSSITYAGCGGEAAAANLINSSASASSSEVVQPWRFPPRYELAPAQADGLGPDLLLRWLLRGSAPQGGAAALALLLAGGHHHRSFQALAVVALAAAGANHWIYLKLLGLASVNAPGDLVLALDAATIYFTAVLNLLGFLVLLLGAWGPKLQGGDRDEAASPILALELHVHGLV